MALPLVLMDARVLAAANFAKSKGRARSVIRLEETSELLKQQLRALLSVKSKREKTMAQMKNLRFIPRQSSREHLRKIVVHIDDLSERDE